MDNTATDKQTFWKGKKVLITGHTGFKGSWLCKILERFGADVTGFALEPAEQPNLFELCGLLHSCNTVIGDIRNFDRIFSLFSDIKPEIVIHMAAQPLVVRSYHEPRYTYDVNVMGTVNILECIRLCDSVRFFLNVTTDKVYFNLERTAGYREDEKLCGSDPYSNSKSCSEIVTSGYYNSFLHDMNVAVSTVRSGNVIGGGDFSENRIVPDCARHLSRNEPILLRNPNSTRPYQHVLDTLFAYLLVIEKQYAATADIPEAFNIGPNENECAATSQLADYFSEAWGELKDGSIARWEHIKTDTPPESEQLRLNCDKIKQKLGWQPRWDIKRAAAETAVWYKAYYGNKDFMSVMERQIEEFI